MAKDELIDNRVSMRQCKRAIEALHSHEVNREKSKQENELFGPREQTVWLVLAVKKMFPEHKIKPFRIPVQYPIVDPRTTGVCLICKDPQREYKDLLESHGIKFISRVVGITKLKGKFKPYEARRMLLKDHGLFLADERVIPLLPRLLGKKWFEAKKQPIPVCLTRKDLKRELERAINSTYMHQNRGTCTSVKIGTLSHTPSQIVANIMTAVPAIANTVKGGWENIQSLYVKTHSSASLPIWTCNLDESDGGRWNSMVKEIDDSVSESPSDSDDHTSSTSGDEDEEPVKASGHRPHRNGEKPKVTEDDGPSDIKTKAARDATIPRLKQTRRRQHGTHSAVAMSNGKADDRLANKTRRIGTVDEPQFKKHKTAEAVSRGRGSDPTVTQHTKDHLVKTNLGKRKSELETLSNSGNDHSHKRLIKATKSNSSGSSTGTAGNGTQDLSHQKAIWIPTRVAEKKTKIGIVERKKMKLLRGKLGRTTKRAVLGKRIAGQ